MPPDCLLQMPLTANAVVVTAEDAEAAEVTYDSWNIVSLRYSECFT